jgi:hypothetical protein
MKKIKTAEEYLEIFETEIEDGGEFGMFSWLVNAQYEEVTNIIKQVQLDMLEYAVNKSLDNAYAIGEGSNLTSKNGNLYWTFAGSIDKVIIDKQSILKTIDEIKEELKV